jgi:hypothetical protein
MHTGMPHSYAVANSRNPEYERNAAAGRYAAFREAFKVPHAYVPRHKIGKRRGYPDTWFANVLAGNAR